VGDEGYFAREVMGGGYCSGSGYFGGGGFGGGGFGGEAGVDG